MTRRLPEETRVPETLGSDDLWADVFALVDAGRPFALATIAAAEGGPWPVGSQMVITQEFAHGHVSDGCIDADVALHGRRALVDGVPRHLVYGRGSPFIDTRLPCGGRIELLVERVTANDPALAELRRLTAARVPGDWESDGRVRTCRAAGEPSLNGAVPIVRRRFVPAQRLIVLGSDPFALAITAAGANMGWTTHLIDPAGRAAVEPPIMCMRQAARPAIGRLSPDRWTAVAVATHDADLDAEALSAALASDAGYIGVLGSRRRLPERLERLRDHGSDDAALARLHAPIGLELGATTPREVAVSVVAEIIADARGFARGGLRERQA